MEVRLTLKKATKGRNIFRLKAAQSTIGRAHGCVVRIPSADVSREHCRVMVEENTVTVQDLGSLNGTLLNGVVIDGVKEVHPGDFLRVGPALFEVQFDPASFVRGEEEEFVVLEDDEEIPAGGDFALEVIDEPPLDQPIPLVDAEPPMSAPRVAESDPTGGPSWHIPRGNPAELRDMLADLDVPSPAQPAKKKKKRRK